MGEQIPNEAELNEHLSRKIEVTQDVFIFGLPFWNASFVQMHGWWKSVLADERRAGAVLVFANAHTLNLSLTHPEFRQALLEADVRVNDGIGFRIGSKMRGVETRYNLNGSDLVPRLLSESASPVRVFVYGGVESANRGAAEALTKLSALVSVVGRCNGYVDPLSEALPSIAAANADVVLVALGQPNQELFCAANRSEMNAKIVLPVGGLIDFLSETKPRAPEVLRRIGLEWTYRLAIEPKRMFRRYIYGNPVFLLRAMLHAKRDKQRLAGSGSGSNAWSSSQESLL